MSSQLLAKKPTKLRSERIKKYPAPRVIVLDAGYFLCPAFFDAQADAPERQNRIDGRLLKKGRNMPIRQLVGLPHAARYRKKIAPLGKKILEKFFRDYIKAVLFFCMNGLSSLSRKITVRGFCHNKVKGKKGFRQNRNGGFKPFA